MIQSKNKPIPREPDEQDLQNSTGTLVLNDRPEHVIDLFSTKRFILAAWIAIGVYLLGFAVSALIRSQPDFYIYRDAGLRTASWSTHLRLQ
jgi:hypothetical protein